MHCLKNRTVSCSEYLEDFLVVSTGFTIILSVNCILPGPCKFPKFNWEVDDKENSNCKTACKLYWYYIAMFMQTVIKKGW